MRMMRAFVIILTVVCISLSVHVTSSAAQSLPLRPVPSLFEMPSTISPSASQMAEIEKWTRDYTAWKAWFAKWRNTREPSEFGTRPRRQRPDPPAALVLACPVPSDEAGPLGQACRLLDEWLRNDVATEIITQQTAATRTRKENDQKTIWWHHVHLDALWPMTQGTTGVFGVLGLHTTIDLTGRIELFLAPGAILLRVPSQSGNGQWKPATDWGFSFRLADFTMPRISRPATLHVNLARVWLIGGSDSVPGVRNDMYLGGFSLTFKKVQTP